MTFAAARARFSEIGGGLVIALLLIALAIVRPFSRSVRDALDDGDLEE